MSKAIKGVTFIAVAGAALAGCATTPPPPPPPPPVVVVVPIRPTPPNGAVVGFILPNKDVVGHFLTPSVNLGRDETLWHMRMALNVAALSCDFNGPTAPLYTQFLKLHLKPLDAANKAEDQMFQAQYGKGKTAVAARDTHMTDAYNFYSLPTVNAEFCAAANNVLTTANATPTASIVDYAPTGLSTLDGTFTNFFSAYEKYLIDVAAWDAKYGAPVSTTYYQPSTAAVEPVVQTLPTPTPTPPSPQR